MSADEEVLTALREAVQESGQTEKLNSALAAWLNAMSEFEIGQNDHRRYLESAKHAMNEVAGSGTP